MREKIGEKNDTFRWLLFLALTVSCGIIGMGAFVSDSPIKDKLFSPAGKMMLGETLVFFLWQYMFFCLPEGMFGQGQEEKKRRVQMIGIGFGLALGLWCHQVLLPFLVAGGWLLGILLFGDFLFRRVKGSREKGSQEKGNREKGSRENRYLRFAADFLIGSGGWITLSCILSAFSIGGLKKSRMLAAVLVLAVLAETGIEFWRKKKQEGLRGKKPTFFGEQRKGSPLKKREGLFCALMLTMVFVQLARINLTPDYDSLHYGLRSHYILDGGRGIYENLGNIHLVYTYPKGWEIFSFPLSGTVTYGYQLCFNLWMAILAVILSGGLVFWISRRRSLALFAGMLISLVPGVMNMGITAKSDLPTLVCQLLILWGAVGIARCNAREEKTCWFFLSLSACLLSFSMKPTALVFSTVLSLSCLAGLFRCRGFSSDSKEKEHGRSLWLFCTVPLFCCAGAWLGTWIRTWKMTGVPTTSVFTSIWDKLGFSVAWPYAFSSIPSQGLGMEKGASAVFFLKRLMGVLLAPTGEDMFHVRLAWGSGVTLLGLAAWLFWGVGKEKAKSCLKAAAFGVGLFSLLSLYLLWQVDGNYYMLFYVLAAVIGSLALENSPFFSDEDREIPANGEKSENRQNFRNRENAGNLGNAKNPGKLRGFSWATGTVFAVFVLLQAGIVLGTNWAGSTGFTPIKLFHAGVVNHQQQRYQEKCDTGNQEIWNILSQNPRTRVIAVGEHPQVLQFPCNVQSYYDITGSGGNVRLVKTLEDFKQFLRFARTEYIYVEAGYLEEGTRAYDVVRYLIEEGSLADLRFAYGNMLGRVNLDGEILADPEREADNFYQQIQLKSADEG